MSMDRCPKCDRPVDTDFDLSFYDTEPPRCERCREDDQWLEVWGLVEVADTLDVEERRATEFYLHFSTLRCCALYAVAAAKMKQAMREASDIDFGKRDAKSVSIYGLLATTVSYATSAAALAEYKRVMFKRRK
jgi:hypothetical protein